MTKQLVRQDGVRVTGVEVRLADKDRWIRCTGLVAIEGSKGSITVITEKLARGVV